MSGELEKLTVPYKGSHRIKSLAGHSTFGATAGHLDDASAMRAGKSAQFYVLGREIANRRSCRKCRDNHVCL